MLLRSSGLSLTILAAVLASGCQTTTNPAPPDYSFHMPEIPEFKPTDFKLPASSLDPGSMRPWNPFDDLQPKKLHGTRKLTMNQTHEQECTAFRKSLADMPGFVQGSIEVPEDWKAPAGRKIQIFYYAHLTDVEGHKLTATPTVFFNGGPCSSSHSSLETVEAAAAPDKIPMVYIDQRGTGCSSPYPDGLNAQSFTRIAFYTSRSIVRDAEAVREKLFGPGSRWKVIGQSYGGMIVHRYIEEVPQSIETAVAHGFAIAGQNEEQGVAKQRSRKLNTLSEDYFRKYPGDEKIVADIRAQIGDDYCFEYSMGAFCGPGMLDSMWVLLAFSNGWPILHDNLSRLLDQNGIVQEYPLAVVVTTYAYNFYLEMMIPAGVLSEVEISSTLAINQSRQVEAAKVETDSGLNQLHFARSIHTEQMGQVWQENSPRLPHDPLQVDDVIHELDRNPGLKFLLYSSAQDGEVPPPMFEDEVKKLGDRVTYQVLKNSGHDGFASEASLWNDLAKTQRPH